MNEDDTIHRCRRFRRCLSCMTRCLADDPEVIEDDTLGIETDRYTVRNPFVDKDDLVGVPFATRSRSSQSSMTRYDTMHVAAAPTNTRSHQGVGEIVTEPASLDRLRSPGNSRPFVPHFHSEHKMDFLRVPTDTRRTTGRNEHRVIVPRPAPRRFTADRQAFNEPRTHERADHDDSRRYPSKHEHTADNAGPPTDKKWYHGGITEDQAIERLRTAHQNGTYLVYDNPSRRGEYALLAYSHGRLHHWRITRRTDGMYMLEGNTSGARAHDSLKKLIKYHRGITGKPIVLAHGGRVILGDYVSNNKYNA